MTKPDRRKIILSSVVLLCTWEKEIRDRREADKKQEGQKGEQQTRKEEEEEASRDKGKRKEELVNEEPRLTLEYLTSALLSPAGKMSKSSSRLGRPGSAGPKCPSLRKELQGNRSCMLRIGERLMRAGSEGNLVQRPIPAQNQSHASSAGLGQGSNGQTQSSALEDKPTEHTRNNCNKGKVPLSSSLNKYSH